MEDNGNYCQAFLIESVQINEYNKTVKVYKEETKGNSSFMELMTTLEISKVWGVSSRRVALLCSQGRVEGAIKKGKTWLIPAGAEKPDDPRRAGKQAN